MELLFFSTACSRVEHAQDANTQSTSTAQAAESADDELNISCPLNDDQLKILKAVYLSMAVDVPTLRTYSMCINSPKHFLSYLMLLLRVRHNCLVC